MSESTAEVTDPNKGVDEAGKIIHNERKRIEKLNKQAQRAHEWRVQVWAQMEQKIRTVNAQLEILNAPKYDAWEPAFGDDEALAHYTTMPITK